LPPTQNRVVAATNVNAATDAKPKAANAIAAKIANAAVAAPETNPALAVKKQKRLTQKQLQKNPLRNNRPQPLPPMKNHVAAATNANAATAAKPKAANAPAAIIANAAVAAKNKMTCCKTPFHC
jgi:hypothetical protein